jgi:hypothetical protein
LTELREVFIHFFGVGNPIGPTVNPGLLVLTFFGLVLSIGVKEFGREDGLW